MIETLYKLTRANMTTHNDHPWVIGKPFSTKRKGTVLCSPDVVHAYRDADLALLLNPRHANYSPVRLFEARGHVIASDYEKVGCHRLVLTKECPLPDWFTDSKKAHRVRVAFALLCAESVLNIFEVAYPTDKRPREAIVAIRAYLNNPSDAAARAAANAAYAAAYAADAAAYAAANAAARAAAYAAARAAADAAYAAAYAAYAAANAAYAARAANAADAAAYAAAAARAAAYAAANAAYAARAANAAADAANLVSLAQLAVKEGSNVSA